MAEYDKTILIVDDEPDILDYLKAFFEDNGFKTLTAKDGKECMQLALDKKPDLITLDISMPEQSGVKTYRDLQDSGETKDIPIIVITGVTGEFKKFISTRRQVEPPTSYFEKPIDREKLLEEIKTILKLN